MFTAAAHRLAGLRARYAEPHRAYHGQSHIDAMLLGWRADTASLAQPDAVELAIWYHDAVYDPAATDNEASSAALLRTEMAALADPALIEAACTMVQASASHTVPPGLPGTLAGDTAAFLDLDMAILGAAPPDYDRYEQGIAAEYAPVHGAAGFRRGRATFLHAMLARERLFLTDRAHDRLDQAARANIRRALATLDGTAGP